MLSDSSILRHIERQPKKTASYKQLVRELGARGGEARHELTDRLYVLVKKRQLLEVDSGRYAIPHVAQEKTGRNALVGRLSMHRDGYGFVIPDAHSLDPNLKARLAGDVFIPPPAIGSAMHGDRVLAEITAFRTDGRAEGRIVRSVSRAHPTVVGIFHYDRRYNYVKPIDGKVTQEIVIPPGMEYPKNLTTEDTENTEKILRKSSVTSVPSAVKALAHSSKKASGKQKERDGKVSVDRVIGDQAARHTDWVDLEGVVVDVEITDWPSATQNPRGRVIEILGEENDFGVDVEIMIRKFHCRTGFRPRRSRRHELLKVRFLRPSCGDGAITAIYPSSPLTAKPPATSTMPYVRQPENGNYELQVHIADVAHYVTPGFSAR